MLKTALAAIVLATAISLPANAGCRWAFDCTSGDCVWTEICPTPYDMHVIEPVAPVAPIAPVTPVAPIPPVGANRMAYVCNNSGSACHWEPAQ
jgi:hypothetical protein